MPLLEGMLYAIAFGMLAIKFIEWLFNKWYDIECWFKRKQRIKDLDAIVDRAEHRNKAESEKRLIKKPRI